MKKYKWLFGGLLLLFLFCSACGKTQAEPEGGNTGAFSAGEEQREAVQALLDHMTLEEKVGQLFWVRCPAENAGEAAAEYQFGGYILFARDFEGETPESVRKNLADYQDRVKIPMLLGVDEEGGTVNRISRFSAFRDAPFLSPRQLYAQGGFAAIQADTAEKCRLLSELGLNVNLAPICDVCGDPAGFLYDRSFGGDGEQVARYVQTVVEQAKADGMGTVLKHFPGYGDNGDTHAEIIRDTRSYETYESSDFLPFQAGISAGAGCVLVNHTIVACMDGERPASLSPDVHQVLREELGFDGVIMTDDLSMAAITQYCGGGEAAVQAVKAGNDLLCCSDYQTQYAAVLQAVQAGEISRSRLEESVARLLLWKQALGLL